MPIRFRCLYCEKLLGIAKRKAGSIVECPGCSKKLIVPNLADDHSDVEPVDEEMEPSVDKPAVHRIALFERDDYEALLENDGIAKSEGQNGKVAVAKPQVVPVQTPVSVPPPPLVKPPVTPVTEGLILTPERLMWVGISAVLIVVTVFAAGILVGRIMK